MIQWLLHLLTEDDPEVVVHGTRILSRLIVIHGSSYATKFATKTGGFTIMRHRLKRWWDIPAIWPLCLSILFAQDIAEVDFERPIELFSLLETFGSSKVVYPGILPVLMSMLQNGLKNVLRHQDGPESPLDGQSIGHDQCLVSSQPSIPPRHRSMSLTQELENRPRQSPAVQLRFLLTAGRERSTKYRPSQRPSHYSPHSNTFFHRFTLKIVRL